MSVSNTKIKGVIDVYRRMKRVLPLPLVLAMLFFSFGTAFAKTTESAKEYSGEEIFKGIVFGLGDLGGKLPVDPKVTKDLNNNQDTLAAIETILAEMDRLDSTYFSELQDAAYSKNPLKVDKAIDEGGALLEKALDNLGFLTSSKPDADTSAFAAGWLVMVAAAAYNYAGVAHTAIAGVNAGAYLNLWVYQYQYFWGSSQPSTKLERETYILEVIEALDN